MGVCYCVFLLLASFLCASPVCDGQERHSFSYVMPDVVPEEDNEWLCISLRLDPKEPLYITGFNPKAMEDIHHMYLSSCSHTWNSTGVFKCQRSNGQSRCPTTERIIYAWSMDVPEFRLPEGMAIKVGGGGEEQHLILQIHYMTAEKFKDGRTDNSGLILEYTKTPQKKNVGIFLLHGGLRILPKSTEFVEITCLIHEHVTIHPFAFRTHTHDLGRMVYGYKVNEIPGEKWTLIGKKNPQLPQMFYPTMNNVTISRGDRIAVRCTMRSDRDYVTIYGPDKEDEVCNFYVMYWTDSETSLGELRPQCWTPGPPSYYWKNEGFINIPEDASTLPTEENI